MAVAGCDCASAIGGASVASVIKMKSMEALKRPEIVREYNP